MYYQQSPYASARLFITTTVSCWYIIYILCNIYYIYKAFSCISACLLGSPISQIPQCMRQISHNSPLRNINVHTGAHFYYKMVHCEIWKWFIVWFAQQVYLLGSDRLRQRSLTSVYLLLRCRRPHVHVFCTWLCLAKYRRLLIHAGGKDTTHLTFPSNQEGV